MSRSFVGSVIRGHFNILPKRDMGKEFRLLYEIKDIREELNMLKSLTETQKKVWRQALRTSLSKYPHLQTPRQVALEIKEVAREAESTQDAVSLAHLTPFFFFFSLGDGLLIFADQHAFGIATEACR